MANGYRVTAEDFTRGKDDGSRSYTEHMQEALITAKQRLELARQALIATGYFNADEVSDDIAPRIAELFSAKGRYAKEERWNDMVVRYEADTIEGVLALEAADVANKAKPIVLPNRPETIVSAVAYQSNPSLFTDTSRDLVWNVPNDKGEPARRFIIAAGKWRRHSTGVIVPGSDGTDCLIPFAEVEYAPTTYVEHARMFGHPTPEERDKQRLEAIQNAPNLNACRAVDGLPPVLGGDLMPNPCADSPHIIEG